MPRMSKTCPCGGVYHDRGGHCWERLRRRDAERIDALVRSFWCTAVGRDGRIPSFDAIPSLGLNQAQRQVSTQAFTIDTLPKLRTNPVINKPVLPKPQEQRFVPTGFIFPLYDPVEAAKQRRSKMKKKKTKKTWWQTPENWYEPYYWGGKNQMGSGYVTFTGKEPTKVRKYEKRFFGIGVNDTPFGVRSKWF